MTISQPRVTSTKYIENIKLQKDKELIFDFQVGPKIMEVYVILRATVKNLDKKKVQL